MGLGSQGEPTDHNCQVPVQGRGRKGGTKGTGRALLVVLRSRRKVEMRTDKVESSQQLLSSRLSLLFTSSFYKNFTKHLWPARQAEIWGDMAVILTRHLLWR